VQKNRSLTMKELRPLAAQLGITCGSSMRKRELVGFSNELRVSAIPGRLCITQRVGTYLEYVLTSFTFFVRRRPGVLAKGCMSHIEVRRAFWCLYSACCEQSDRLLFAADDHQDKDDIWRDCGEPWRGVMIRTDVWRTSDIMKWGPLGVREDARILVRAVFSNDVALASAVIGQMRKLAPAPVDPTDHTDNIIFIKEDVRFRQIWRRDETCTKQDPELAARLPAWPEEGFATRFTADVLLSAAVGECRSNKVMYIVQCLLEHGPTTDVREVKRRFLALMLFTYRINQQAPTMYTMSGAYEKNFAMDISDISRVARGHAKHGHAKHFVASLWMCLEAVASRAVCAAAYAATANPASPFSRSHIGRAKRRFAELATYSPSQI
jgi:hypothetical protein